MLPTRLLSATTLLLVVALGVPGTASSQEERAEGPTPPRLARTDGDVSFWRPGADEWAPAQVNTPLAAGDRLYVSSGEALVELTSRAGVRIGGDTEMGLASLETGYLQLEVPSGRVALDLQDLPQGQRVELDTPNGAFTIDRAGYYRVDVQDDTKFVVRRGGEATAIPADGNESPVRDGDEVVLTGTESATIATNRAPAPDQWDGFDTAPPRVATARSAQYVGGEVAGVQDLDQHGDWRATSEYGQVWVPRDVGPDWAPYTTGRWTYDPYYEWTWVDDASWGWAPYHYGRWVYADNYWGWAPGPVVAQPVYAPALVGFLGAPGVDVSVSIGAPFVSWVALGWGEPCLPWWGPHGFRGRPYWGGWRGPRYVNDVYVDNRRIVNVNNITRYRNFDARNAVVGMRRDRFGRGRDNVRLTRNDINHLQPMRGTLGVRPDRASLVARDGRGKRPPARFDQRSVVATRHPQDTSRRLQRAGIAAPSPQERGPQTRIAGRGGEGRGGNRDRRMDARDDRPSRQALRGDAPPPPRMGRGDRDRNAFGGQAPSEQAGRGRRNDADRQADRGRDRAFGQQQSDGEGRNGRDRRDDADRRANRGRDRNADRNALGQGQPDRQERNGRRNGPNADGERQADRGRGGDRFQTTPPPMLSDQPGANQRRANRGEERRQQRNGDGDRRRASRGNDADLRGDAPEPPRGERQRQPQGERREMQQPRMDRQPRGDRQPRVERQPQIEQRQPRAERQMPPRQERQPRAERQPDRGRAVEQPRSFNRMPEQRREMARPRPEPRQQNVMRQPQRAPEAPRGGGGDGRGGGGGGGGGGERGGGGGGRERGGRGHGHDG